MIARAPFLAFSLLPLAATTPSLRAHRTAQPPVMDGRLDEAVWTEAAVLRDFTQQWPELSAPSQKRTEVRVLYDDHFLYVGGRLFHPKGKVDVVRQVHRRDQSSPSDWFACFIDSAHDHRAAFSFMVNAANVQRDGIHFEDQGDDLSWDGVWESAVHVDEEGWSAELKIPLSLLRFHNGGGPQRWGINFARRDEGKARETSYWYMPARGVNAWVSGFHHLEGLEGLKPQPRREWLPYLSLQRKFETTQPYDDRRWTTRAGLDAHLGLSTHSQLDLSLRPDFGQVEVDQAVLNLSTVETYFPEKRPFFIEGMELFQLPGTKLFYSRRIGPGLGAPALNPGEQLLDRPTAAEITAAAKYTAKYSGGLSLGLLGASVEAARARIMDASGQELRRELAPATSAGVARATRAFGERGSYLGAFASWFNQVGPQGRQAQVGAIDGAWKSKDRSSTLDFVLAHSNAGPRNATEAGDFLRVHGVTAWGKGWSVDGNAFTVGRRFEPNDLGYLDRPDRKGFTFDLDKRWDLKRGIFQNPFWRFTYCDFRDQAGHPYTQYVESWGKTEFTNGWAIFAGGGVMAPLDEDRELRSFKGPVKKYLRVPEGQWLLSGFDSPANRPWAVNFQWNQIWREGGPKDEVQLTHTIKPMPRLEVKLETSYTHASGEWHWVETQGDTPIVGMRRLSQLDQVLRIAYAFTPNLTVQVFSQWLAGSWAFRDLRSWQAPSLLLPGANSTQSPASSDRLWNLNLITRWEFRPGSHLFFVYTHGAWTDQPTNGRGSLSPGRDLALMQHLPSDDAVQLKFSWLFR